MVKSKEDTITQFNELMNMSKEELEKWKIIEILKKNPDKDPEKYDDDDLEHMRKVVGYNKRHMKQEDHLKETKTVEELEKTKSAISMKNWGHDPIKTLDGHEDAPDAAHDTQSDEAASTEDKDPRNDKDKGTREAKDGSNTGGDHNGSKRKLDAADEDKDTASHSKSAEETEAALEASPNDDDDEAEEPTSERPRKKSKTVEQVEKEAEKEAGHESDTD